MKTLKLATAAIALALVPTFWGAALAAPSEQEIAALRRTPYGQSITLEQAKLVVAAAEAEARRRGVADIAAIAVTEPSGELVMYVKGTGAQYAAYEFAYGKARTAGRYRRPTSVMAAEIAKGSLQPLAYEGAMVAGAGGVPIVVGGRMIGAIGTTGGFDEEVAQAGVAALK
jgi:uncharacterized protein GlcG (DUF336 family)